MCSINFLHNVSVGICIDASINVYQISLSIGLPDLFGVVCRSC